MSDTAFATLAETLDDDLYPEVDLALRRGGHIGRDDGPTYDFLVDAQALLEGFYRRFGCELIQQSDGYFYLLPASDKLGRRLLSSAEMLVGQTLALLYLDPATLQHGGLANQDTLLQRLGTLHSIEDLVRIFDARKVRKARRDERVAAEFVRGKVAYSLRRLAELGFIDLLDDARLRLRSALMRFAEPVRGLGEPKEALERLIRVGEVVVEQGETESVEDSGDEEVSP